jgi:hypothetical protein
MGGGQESALRAEMMAGAVVTAHNYVLRRWLRGLTDEPKAEFDDAMGRTVELFTENAPAPGRRSIVVFDTDRDVAALLPALRNLLGEPEIG